MQPKESRVQQFLDFSIVQRDREKSLLTVVVLVLGN